ncbi:hypothetical protein TNCV_834441 [Trichonephila clavipes]|nr:hypothetical protein TNCV_834441 [Trichonephila clavipes]
MPRTKKIGQVKHRLIRRKTLVNAESERVDVSASKKKIEKSEGSFKDYEDNFSVDTQSRCQCCCSILVVLVVSILEYAGLPVDDARVVVQLYPIYTTLEAVLPSDNLVASVPLALSEQHTTITGPKAEPAFIRKHNISPLRSQMSSSVTALASEM